MSKAKQIVNRETTKKYLDYLFEQYNIDENVQPNLREAIYRYCESKDGIFFSSDLSYDKRKYEIVKKVLVHTTIELPPTYDKTKIEHIVKYFGDFVMDKESRELNHFESFINEETCKKLQRCLIYQSCSFPFNNYQII